MRFGGGEQSLSYYRFRNADPSILINKYDTYKTDESKELVLLNRNFRSSPEVINGINSIFKRIMSREVGEIDYDEEAYLIPSRTDHTAKPEIHLLRNSGSDEEKIADIDTVQAHFIARKIKELVENGEAEYKDIGILYRTIKGRIKTIIKAFDEEGIPFIFEGESELNHAQEIELFLQLLDLIDNHKQDIPLLTVIKLPIFNFSDDDLIKIKKTYKEKKYIYQAIESYRDNEDDELSEKLKSFYKDLESWRELSKQLDMEDFLWKILLDSGFYSYAGSLPNGNERKGNLRILLERAKNYKNTYLKGISSFLQYLNELGEKGQIISGKVGSAENTNTVKIMTIHKSKGLEFPVLFLADTHKKFRTDTKDFLTHLDYGYGGQLLELKDDVLIKRDLLLTESFKTIKKTERYSELLRILYVALTRAQNRLFVVGVVNKKKNLEKDWKTEISPTKVLNSQSMLDWIMLALYNPNQKEFSTNDWNIIWNDYKDYIDVSSVSDKEEIVLDESYERLKNQIYEQLEKPQEIEPNENPLKMSVSRIKHYGLQTQEEVDLEPLEINKKKIISPTLIGSAVHSLLQFIDLKEYKKTKDKEKFLDIQKNLLVKKGLIAEETSKSIEADIIIDFLDSPLGKRLIDAKDDDVLKEVSFALDINPEDLKESLPEIERNLEISGIIDCCFIDNNEWILLDYKTDRYYNEDDWKKRIKEYSLQINLYALALERLTGKRVKEKHLCFLTNRENILL